MSSENFFSTINNFVSEFLDEKTKERISSLKDQFDNLSSEEKDKISKEFPFLLKNIYITAIPVVSLESNKEKEKYLDNFENKVSSLFSEKNLEYNYFNFSTPNKERYDYILDEYSKIDSTFENLKNIIPYRIYN